MKRWIKPLAPLILLVYPSIQVMAQDDSGQGHQLFDKWCAPCHGEGEAASIFLAEKYQGALPGAIEQRSDLTRDLVTLRIRTQIPGMPAFRPTEISDGEAGLIADYLTGGEAK